MIILSNTIYSIKYFNAIHDIFIPKDGWSGMSWAKIQQLVWEIPTSSRNFCKIENKKNEYKKIHSRSFENTSKLPPFMHGNASGGKIGNTE